MEMTMSYSMMVAGTMTLPAGRLEDYLASPVDPTQRQGWIGTLENAVRMCGKAAGTVREVLDRMPRRLIASAGSWLEIELSAAGIVRVHGVFAEDDFTDHGPDLAEAF